MNDVTRSSQFIVNSLNLYDIIHIQKIFQAFQFLLFFSSTCNLFLSLRGAIQFFFKQ